MLLTPDERLILAIWDEVEDKCSTKQIEEIQEGVGWTLLVCTIASLRWKSDMQRGPDL